MKGSRTLSVCRLCRITTLIELDCVQLGEGCVTEKAKVREQGDTEVVSWLRVPKSTLYKLCQAGEIRTTKIGRHWRFDQAVV